MAGGEKMNITSQNGFSNRANYLVRQAQERAMNGDHETAVNYLKEVVEREPQHAAAFTMLGDCHDCLGQYEQAIAYYSQALGIDPDHADAWFNKGMTLKVLGRTEEAVQCIEKSIELYCGR